MIALANGYLTNLGYAEPPLRGWQHARRLDRVVTFLDINDHPLPDTALLPLAEQIIAQHELTDRHQADAVLSAWLRAHLERRARSC